MRPRADTTKRKNLQGVLFLHLRPHSHLAGRPDFQAVYRSRKGRTHTEAYRSVSRRPAKNATGGTVPGLMICFKWCYWWPI